MSVLPEVGFMKPFSYMTGERVNELVGKTKDESAQIVRNVLLYVLNEEKTRFVLFHGHLYTPNALLSDNSIRYIDSKNVRVFLSQFLYSVAELHFRNGDVEETRYLVGEPDAYCVIHVPDEDENDPVRICSIRQLDEALYLINSATFLAESSAEEKEKPPKIENSGISGSYQSNIVTLPFRKK